MKSILLQTCRITLVSPQELLDDLVDGKWSVSLKGYPYHNFLAIDEAHKCYIKQMTETNDITSITFQNCTIGTYYGVLGCTIAWSRELYVKTKLRSQIKRKGIYFESS